MKIYIIRFDRNSYEVRIGFNENIFFADGSGDYTLTVEDPQILEAEVKENGKRVTIHANKKGETTLIITDNIAGGTVKLKIKATDSYIGFVVTGYSNHHHPVFTPNTYLFLVNNENMDFYLFDPSSVTNGLVLKGSYEVGRNEPYMRFNYTDLSSNENELYFNIGASDELVLTYLNRWLELGWEKKLLSTRMPSPVPYFLRLSESDADEYPTNCLMQMGLQIGENVLK